MHLPAGRREPGLRGEVQGADDQRLGLAPRAQQQGAGAQAWRMRGGHQVGTFKMHHTVQLKFLLKYHAYVRYYIPGCESYSLFTDLDLNKLGSGLRILFIIHRSGFKQLGSGFRGSECRYFTRKS
jgi:hypothetical protein